MTETKNEALELAQELENSYAVSDERDQVAAMLRSQAAAIEKLKARVESALCCSENANKVSAEYLRERDQLKAKNQKLVEALKSVVNVGGLAAVSVAEQALKENT